MPKLSHLLITREQESIFIPLPRELWSSAGQCSCPVCYGQEGFFDTLAVHDVPRAEIVSRNRTWAKTQNVQTMTQYGNLLSYMVIC
jgi:hypothetical protein